MGSPVGDKLREQDSRVEGQAGQRCSLTVGFDCLNEDALLLTLVCTSMSSHQPLAIRTGGLKVIGSQSSSGVACAWDLQKSPSRSIQRAGLR